MGPLLQVIKRWWCGNRLGPAYDRLEYLRGLRYTMGQHDLRVHRALPSPDAGLLISPILQEALDTFHETRSHPIPQ
jgi:hypothetical protein